MSIMKVVVLAELIRMGLHWLVVRLMDVAKREKFVVTGSVLILLILIVVQTEDCVQVMELKNVVDGHHTKIDQSAVPLVVEIHYVVMNWVVVP